MNIKLQSARQSLFVDDAAERYSQEAIDLASKAEQLFAELGKEYIERGFSARDVEYVIQQAVVDTFLGIRLHIQAAAHKKAKDAT